MDIGSQFQGVRQAEAVPAAERAQAIETPATEVAGGYPATGTTASDEAHLSDAAVLVHQALALPDVRMDKVEEVQQALSAGTYSVSASAVAEKLMGSMLER
ncbi:flagellar biosynthesis anti-sigma factor FlgM [Paracidobacterium acidisoli]|uniref:Negative regulator of flagellin synthesis n=1 Tax=Paracidobacterium acidisoli TaxID=2303751 RepID=A0A372IRC9_9BACT|nr:flagellar biosynthesis anti-sigma factor FlgM [Paracidobacterium acidisoli]MBT9330316.1 flagellar biosynthesis anti-sigma factor FlgM [Paracidobacterium acidisoli]